MDTTPEERDASVKDRKLVFFDDTSELAMLSAFPTDKKSALCFMQLFCHRLNEVYEKEGIDAVIEIVEYGDAMKKVDRSFENKSEYQGVKRQSPEPQVMQNKNIPQNPNGTTQPS